MWTWPNVWVCSSGSSASRATSSGFSTHSSRRRSSKRCRSRCRWCSLELRGRKGDHMESGDSMGSAAGNGASGGSFAASRLSNRAASSRVPTNDRLPTFVTWSSWRKKTSRNAADSSDDVAAARQCGSLLVSTAPPEPTPSTRPPDGGSISSTAFRSTDTSWPVTLAEKEARPSKSQRRTDLRSEATAPPGASGTRTCISAGSSRLTTWKESDESVATMLVPFAGLQRKVDAVSVGGPTACSALCSTASASLLCVAAVADLAAIKSGCSLNKHLDHVVRNGPSSIR
mmetsp:Transcript_15059/g.47084  ORF Transcript_15059/g.47084 Transcript_15059/m.47084 type:complete len:286 (+) Transcript_15059:76-933(+)